MKFSDGSDQFMQGEGRNTTYVSRMQCVQAAIDQQISEIQAAAPKKKVGLVTFNNEVTIIGDGAMVPKTLAGDKLFDFDGLMLAAEKEAPAYM